MTLLDAKEYDPAKARKRTIRIVSAIVIVLFVAGFLWWNRYWPEERVAGHFFAALQKQDYKTAYAIWMQDPEWQQHPQQHPKYPFNEFYQDWGPGGQWGLIKTAKDLRIESVPREERRQRRHGRGRRRRRERPHRARADLGGKRRQDAELSAVRTALPLSRIRKEFGRDRLCVWRRQKCRIFLAR